MSPKLAGWQTFLAELRAFLGLPAWPAGGELGSLSRRELQVLELAAEGLSNEQIAARLYVSVRTVERHLSNVYKKLNLSGKAARAAAAARLSRAFAYHLTSTPTTCCPTWWRGKACEIEWCRRKSRGAAVPNLGASN